MKDYNYRKQKLRWYEMLFWDRMPETWKILSPELKEKIKKIIQNIRI